MEFITEVNRTIFVDWRLIVCRFYTIYIVSQSRDYHMYLSIAYRVKKRREKNVVQTLFFFSVFIIDYLYKQYLKMITFFIYLFIFP